MGASEEMSPPSTVAIYCFELCVGASEEMSPSSTVAI